MSRARKLVLLEGIELSTSPLPRGCSTTELQQRPIGNAGRRGIPPGRRCVQGAALTRIPEQTCRRGVEWVNFRSVSRFDLSSSSREPFVRVPLHVGRVLACGRATVASPGPEFRTSLGAAA